MYVSIQPGETSSYLILIGGRPLYSRSVDLRLLHSRGVDLSGVLCVDIANDAVFRRRNKDIYDCYDRFCELVDKFMELRVMDQKERPYWEHYKMFRWVFHDCRNKFPDN